MDEPISDAGVPKTSITCQLDPAEPRSDQTQPTAVSGGNYQTTAEVVGCRSTMDAGTILKPTSTVRERKKKQLQEGLKKLKSLIRSRESAVSQRQSVDRPCSFVDPEEVDTIQAVNIALRVIAESQPLVSHDPKSSRHCCQHAAIQSTTTFSEYGHAIRPGRVVPTNAEVLAELLVDADDMTILQVAFNHTGASLTTWHKLFSAGANLLSSLNGIVDDSSFDNALRSCLSRLSSLPVSIYTRIRVNDEFHCCVLYCERKPQNASSDRNLVAIQIHRKKLRLNVIDYVYTGAASFMTKHHVNLRFKSWEPSILVNTGYLPHETTGCSFLDWFHSEDVASFGAAFLSAIGKRSDSRLIRVNQPFRLRLKSGAYGSVVSEWWLCRCPWSGRVESMRGRHTVTGHVSGHTATEQDLPINLTHSTVRRKRIDSTEEEIRRVVTQLPASSLGVGTPRRSDCHCGGGERAGTSDENHNTKRRPSDTSRSSAHNRYESLKRSIHTLRHRSLHGRVKKQCLREQQQRTSPADPKGPSPEGSSTKRMTSTTSPPPQPAVALPAGGGGPPPSTSLGAFVDRLVETMVLGTAATTRKRTVVECRSGSSEEPQELVGPMTSHDGQPQPPSGADGRGGDRSAGGSSGGRSPQDSTGTTGSNTLSYTQISCLENVHRLLQSHPNTAASPRRSPSQPAMMRGAGSGSPSSESSPPPPSSGNHHLHHHNRFLQLASATMHRSHSAGEVAADQPMPLTRELLRRHTRQWEKECKESWKRKYSADTSAAVRPTRHLPSTPALVDVQRAAAACRYATKRTTVKEPQHTEITVTPLAAPFSRPASMPVFHPPPTAAETPLTTQSGDISWQNAGKIAPKGVDFYRALGPNPPPPPGRNFRITSFPIPQSSIGFHYQQSQPPYSLLQQHPLMLHPQTATLFATTVCNQQKIAAPAPQYEGAPAIGMPRKSAFVPPLGVDVNAASVIQASPLLAQLSQQYQRRQMQLQHQHLRPQRHPGGGMAGNHSQLTTTTTSALAADAALNLAMHHSRPAPEQTKSTSVEIATEQVALDTAEQASPQASSAVKEATLMLLQGT